MNYLSYLELLIKMVKYNTEFESHYEKLIEVIDKDDKLTVKDMEIVSDIVDEILKEEDLDESILEIADKLKDMYAKIAKLDTEADKDKEDKKPKEPKEEKPKEEKPEETFVDFVLRMKTRVVERVTLKEDATKVNSQKAQIMKLKEATISLTNQLETSINKEPETIEKVITEIEYKVPKEVTERIGELNGKILALKKSNNNESEDRKKEANEFNEMLDNRDELLGKAREDLDILKVEMKDVKESLQEQMSELNKENEGKLSEVTKENEKLILENIKNDELQKASIATIQHTTPMPIVAEMRAVWDAMRPELEAVLYQDKAPADAAKDMQQRAVEGVATIRGE